MEHYGLIREFCNASYYETAHQKQKFDEIKVAIYSGKLVALVGIVECGKTATLRQMQIERLLTLVFETADQVGEKSVTATIFESVVSEYISEASAPLQITSAL